ncbi:hypothetical protein JQ609_18940 [Bradyrhizobium sp. AUGA SZCCT0169]|uniref:hypothetical protein n=1 Tax=Bradyrhizobium sp. AUGA SZCCT0169 TaxID=2807663 RepID=UPI001BAE10B3|nr:hypothetical protein [Bradyrhizobium sp. AUGA SZCCT0169]MBR1248998.1 hypothetical protein [Bradyrhizobium sp. AUGA SZCCT0169]
MRFGPGVAVLALVLSFAAPAAAEDCPAKSRDDVLTKMKTASCNRAMQIASACSGGATGDVGLTDAVETKCEGDFLARLKAQQKKAYQREKDACDRKFSHEEGTMYISFAAFCRAKVAQRYSQRALKAASPARAR